MQAQIAFERAEETFLGSVIPAGIFAGYARNHLLLVQRGLLVTAVVLNPAVRMVNQPGGRLALGARPTSPPPT